jgi:predicted RNA methylase
VTARDELAAKVRSRGFRPARADAEGLFALLASGDRDEAELAERALARLGAEAAETARARFPSARAPERGRLCRLIGRLGDRAFLLRALGDDDAKTRRNAIIALGKLGGEEVDAALRARWPHADVIERRSLAAALGKIGGAPALALLERLDSDDAELTRIAEEARLKLRRTLGRARDEGAIVADRRAPEPLPVRLHARHGLASLVADELPSLRPRIVDDTTVDATLDGTLASLFASRCMLRFGFPLPLDERGLDLPSDLPPAGRAVVAALASDRAARLLSQWTRGPVRYRIEWAEGGHRRSLTFRCAREIERLRPGMVNDPTASLWEATVTETPRIAVELAPRGLDDPRFAYRREHVPASSHPTLAAALARVAGVRADDVVWDPFAGAGSELIERARLGAYRTLHGSDLDAAALDRARANLAAAGVTATLVVADARQHRPPIAPTLILTNPPMGRRVLNKQLTGALYDAFLAHAAELLVPGGRIVWISPRPDATRARAARLGLRVTFQRRVDMAGFWAEIQRLERR